MSLYFNLDELACRDGTPVPAEYLDNALTIMGEADIVRQDLGSAIQVVSAFRTDEHNRGRGVDGSYHLRAMAMDIRPYVKRNGKFLRWKSIPLAERTQMILQLHGNINRLIADGKLTRINGVGLYTSDDTGWVHIDIRPRLPNGRIARWLGSKMGSEKTG